MKNALGLIATAIAIYSYIPYFLDIFKDKTKPHAFSWLVWFVLTVIGFFAQVSDGGGAGAWVTGFTAIIAGIIFVLALFKGEKRITRLDWFFLAAAFAALIPWAFSSNVLLSVVLITVVDALGFAPTFRKAFYRPQEETAITFLLSAIKFIVAIVALSNYSLITMLYPASLVLMNGLFVAMVYVRRQQLGLHATKSKPDTIK